MSLADSYRTASECASDTPGVATPPRVALYCPPGHMIHVRRSFHGARAPGRRCGAGNCTYCTGDCVDETAGVVYDWAACTGRDVCSRTVLQSLMPHCNHQPAKTQSVATS